MADYERLAQLVIEGESQGALDLTEQLLATGTDGREILDKGLLPGMDIVGQRMKTGEIFIPEVLLSARTMQGCLDLIKPRLDAGESLSRGSIVMGTVEGDVHDIGKNLVAMLLEGAGFDVINLGIGVTPQAFVAAVREHRPRLIGMSGLLTTTIPKMGVTVQELKQAGLREQVGVMVGGAPVTQQFADEIGADGYGSNAASAVETAKRLVEGR